MSRLAVYLLGSFQAEIETQQLVQFATDKTRALLVYLAVDVQRAHRRETVANIFWPNRPQASAHNNLRQAIYLLRRALHDQTASPPYLLVSSEEIQLNPASNYWVDVNAFQRGLSACFSHHPTGPALCETCLQELLPAVELYRGDFLAGFSLPDCPDFDWWMLARQETYHRLALEALDRLARHYEQTRQYLQVSQYAQKAIVLEPWRESSHRMKMRALANNGQAQEALRQFDLCRHILNTELGVEPSPQTMRLFQKILAAARGKPAQKVQLQIPTTGTQAESPELDKTRLLCVAREKELGQLNAFLEQARTGNGRVAFVVGEAGSGKSTVVNEFVSRKINDDQDLLVAAGSCHAYTGIGDPYTPFIQILRGLCGVESPGIPVILPRAEYEQRKLAALPDILQAFYEYGPELGSFFPGRKIPGGIEKASDSDQPKRVTKPRRANALQNNWSFTTERQAVQSTLFDQYAQTLCALARQRPLLLVLEDLHWADKGSLSLLFHLGRNLTGSRILIIGTYRPEELVHQYPSVDGEMSDGYHPLESLISEFQIQFGEIKVDLAQASGRDFVEAFLHSESNALPVSFIETLFKHTHGHPLFTVELIRGLQERGDLTLDGSTGWIAAPDINWDILPFKVEAVIVDRLNRLLPTERALLTAASVQGDHFNAEILANILNRTPESVTLTLSKLANVHRLVNPEGLQWLGHKSISNYRFRHFLYQKYLYQGIDPIEKKHLHAAFADELSILYAELDWQDLTNALQLAWHYEKAGRLEQAANYLEKAGQQAYLMSANSEAIAHFQHALRLLRPLTQTPAQVRHELRLQLALSAPLRAERGYADHDAGRAYARAYELAQKLGDTEYYSLAAFLLQSYYIARADYQQALDLGMQLESVSKDLSSTMHLSQANFAMGIPQLLLGKLIPAWKRLSAAGIPSSAAGGAQFISPISRDMRLLSEIFLSWLCWLRGDAVQAQHISQKVLHQVDTLGHPYSRAFALGMSACIVSLLCQDYYLVRTQAEELLQLSERMGFEVFQAMASIYLGRAQVAYGEFQSGIQDMQAGLQLYENCGQRMFLTFLLALLADAYRAAGQPAQGLKVLAQADETIMISDERFFEAELRRLKAALLLEQASSLAPQTAESLLKEAADSLRRAIQVARWQGAKALELRATLDYAKHLLVQGQEYSANKLLSEVYSRFHAEVNLPELLETDRLLDELTGMETA